MTISLWSVAAILAALAAHTAVNARLLRRPPQCPATVDTAISILLPVRDEAHRIEPCLRGLLAQSGVPRLEILVLDDGSRDGTAAVVRRVAGGDARVRLLRGAPLPPGWLGKPHACQQLADVASPATTVLAFVDADVVLAPGALAAASALLEPFDLLSPYPLVVAQTWGERLIQPLLAWSWLTFLPLRAMERSSRPSLAAAGGQFLLVRRRAYRRAGGHAAVRDQVLEDLALARQVKRTGGRIALANGSGLARCRMYASWLEVVAGYTKSLWAAFGSPAGALVTITLLTGLYVFPVAGALAGLIAGSSGWLAAGLSGYALGVLGRLLSARAVAGRVWPDALTQPVSILLAGWLVLRSLRRRRELRWKDRPVEVRRAA